MAVDDVHVTDSISSQFRVTWQVPFILCHKQLIIYDQLTNHSPKP
jgi:hypothetical protein